MFSSNITQPILYIVSTYIVITVLVFFISDSILYPIPPIGAIKTENSVEIILPSKKKVAAYWLPNPQAQYTLLFSHGNGEDIGHIFPLLAYFHQIGYQVFAYDYPGYGLSEGRPSERKNYEAITASYEYLIQELNIPEKNIICFGRSLGSGPTIELASEQRCGALILESPFVSAYRVITQVPLLLFDKYNNIKKLPEISQPTLVIHGTKDEVIPFSHGKKIYNALKGQKAYYWVQGGRHNDLISTAEEQYFRAIKSFTDNLPQD